jgi:hypothetical protein
MDKKPASAESIKILCANMGKNFDLFTPLLCSFVDLYERLVSIDKTNVNEEYQLNCVTICEELIKLKIASMIIVMDLSTFLRANFISDSPTEKRCNLKYINIITYEGFNYFFCSEDDTENSLWSNLKKVALQLDDKELNIDILKATSCAEEFKNKYINYSDIRSRNLSVHYDKDPIIVYENIIQLDEDYEVRRACSFFAIIKSLAYLISKHIDKYLGVLSKHLTTLQPYDLSIHEIVNSFEDASGNLFTTLNDKINYFGESLDKIIYSCNKPKLLIDKLKLDEQSADILKPVIKSFYPGIHLHFIYLDLACAIRAYLKSEYYLEKQMNLRRIRIVLYEGFKKIYGFTDSQESNSFWRADIYKTLKNSSVITITEKLSTVEDCLNHLREYRDFKDIKKREYSVHYRYKENDNIIPIFHLIIDNNPLLEIEKAIRLINILPSIIELNKISIEVIHRHQNEMISIDNRKTLDKIDKIISIIENSNVDEELKQTTIEQMKHIKSLSNLF